MSNKIYSVKITRGSNPSKIVTFYGEISLYSFLHRIHDDKMNRVARVFDLPVFNSFILTKAHPYYKSIRPDLAPRIGLDSFEQMAEHCRKTELSLKVEISSTEDTLFD